MKLLQINITANKGSTGRIAEEIGSLAIAHGWESYIAYGRSAGKSKSKLIHIGNMWDERWHAVQTRLFDRHGLASKKATKSLILKIEKIRPDIIQLHNIHGYYLNYPILFDYLSKIDTPVVWTLHDCWAFTGHCAYFDALGCDKWKSHCGSCPAKRNYPESLLFDNSCRNFNKKRYYFNLPINLVLAPVSYWLDGLLKDCFLKGHDTLTIHNGIDLSNFKPSTKDIFPSVKTPIVLGVASVWEKRKGLNDLVVLSRHDDIQVVLVGIDENTEKQLPKNIICIRNTANQEELAEYYSRADVFVNPTYEDNFPTVNIESLACGTPVVTYRTGGSPESLTDETGIVVAKGDVEELYSAIKAIINKTSEEKEKQRIKCVERAKEFDAKVRFEDYIHLYEKLLSRNNNL